MENPEKREPENVEQEQPAKTDIEVKIDHLNEQLKAPGVSNGEKKFYQEEIARLTREQRTAASSKIEGEKSPEKNADTTPKPESAPEGKQKSWPQKRDYAENAGNKLEKIIKNLPELEEKPKKTEPQVEVPAQKSEPETKVVEQEIKADIPGEERRERVIRNLEITKQELADAKKTLDFYDKVQGANSKNESLRKDRDEAVEKVKRLSAHIEAVEKSVKADREAEREAKVVQPETKAADVREPEKQSIVTTELQKASEEERDAKAIVDKYLEAGNTRTGLEYNRILGIYYKKLYDREQLEKRIKEKPAEELVKPSAILPSPEKPPVPEAPKPKRARNPKEKAKEQAEARDEVVISSPANPNQEQLNQHNAWISAEVDKQIKRDAENKAKREEEAEKAKEILGQLTPTQGELAGAAVENSPNAVLDQEIKKLREQLEVAKGAGVQPEEQHRLYGEIKELRIAKIKLAEQIFGRNLSEVAKEELRADGFTDEQGRKWKVVKRKKEEAEQRDLPMIKEGRKKELLEKHWQAQILRTKDEKKQPFGEKEDFEKHLAGQAKKISKWMGTEEPLSVDIMCELMEAGYLVQDAHKKWFRDKIIVLKTGAPLDGKIKESPEPLSAENLAALVAKIKVEAEARTKSEAENSWKTRREIYRKAIHGKIAEKVEQISANSKYEEQSQKYLEEHEADKEQQEKDQKEVADAEAAFNESLKKYDILKSRIKKMHGIDLDNPTAEELKESPELFAGAKKAVVEAKTRHKSKLEEMRKNRNARLLSQIKKLFVAT